MGAVRSPVTLWDCCHAAGQSACLGDSKLAESSRLPLKCKRGRRAEPATPFGKSGRGKSARGEGARLGGGLHRFGAAAGAACPRKGDLRLGRGNQNRFHPAAFFFHGRLRSCDRGGHLDLGRRMPRQYGKDLAVVLQGHGNFAGVDRELGRNRHFLYVLELEANFLHAETIARRSAGLFLNL